MTLRPPRFGLAMGLAVLVWLAVGAYGFSDLAVPRKPPSSHQRSIRTPAPWDFPPSDGHPTPLTPLVPFGNRPSAAMVPLYVQFFKAPWAPVFCGIVFFNVAFPLLRFRIVLDRRANVLMRDGRVVCPLSDVVRVQIDDTPRIQVMNELALILKEKGRFSVLLYDGSADAGLHAAAETIAQFLGVPVESKKDYSLFRTETK